LGNDQNCREKRNIPDGGGAAATGFAGLKLTLPDRKAGSGSARIRPDAAPRESTRIRLASGGAKPPCGLAIPMAEAAFEF
jgi:hypothetical protein